MKKANIRFYAELNDFLEPEKRFRSFPYAFSLNPSVKDVVEACGVPHPEIDIILVNQKSVDFHYHIRDGDQISVYPVFESLDITPLLRLRSKPLRDTKFLVDDTLGKLARKLRMLGFDTCYEIVQDRAEFLQRALAENRLILTRSQNLLKHKSVTRGYWVRATEVREQVKEVIARFDLYTQINPFQRCLVCNGSLQPVLKATIIDRLPPRIKAGHAEFWLCRDCLKIYWQGTHFERMLRQIKEIQHR